MAYKKALLAFMVIMTVLQLKVTAYNADYPPYLFKDGAPNCIQAELLVSERGEQFYRSKDGQIKAVLIEGHDYNDVMLYDGKNKLPLVWDWYVHSIYCYDVDGNGYKDFIILHYSRMNGLGLEGDAVEIFLKMNTSEYVHIFYGTTYSGIEDFLDLNGDGKAEVIIPGFYYGNKHNFFTYSIYEFDKGKLVNADAKYKGFPKFVWFTFEPNDRNTTSIDAATKERLVKEKDDSIQYEIIRF